MSASGPIFGLGCALRQLDDNASPKRVATVIHYCGLLFEQPSEPRYARLIGHVDLKRRNRDAPLVKRG